MPFYVFLFPAIMVGIILVWCIFTFQARAGMEVPFDLLGTVYHQVIIIILLLRMASTNSKTGFSNTSHILD